jgi:hypothetical protein
MSDHGHRTFVGTLVFLDVLDPRPDALDCVQEAASRAVGHLEAEYVLTIPHPRGLVLVFPGDPEDGLFVALGLRDALEHEASTRIGFGARMSIHLGPVRIVDGVAQGEGPTVGSQLASVATPGQIVASRSFFEVVSSLSAEHKALLHPLGRRRTAEGKEVDVYELGSPVEREVEVTWPHGGTPPAGLAAAAPPALQPIPLVTPVEAPPPAPAPVQAPAPVIVTGGWVAGRWRSSGRTWRRASVRSPTPWCAGPRAPPRTPAPWWPSWPSRSRTGTIGGSSRISPARGSAARGQWAARRSPRGHRTRLALPTPRAHRSRRCRSSTRRRG